MGGAAVVIVNYGSHELLAANVSRELAAHDVLVVVVDNFSTDAERAAVTALAAERGWELVAMPGNPGFSDGVNAGVARARELGRDGFVALNPDAVATPQVLDELYRSVRADVDSVISPLVVDSGGRPSYSGSLVDQRSGRTRKGWDEADERWRPWLTGACMAFSDQAFDALGGFATGYFLYWEDVDFSRRAEQAGLTLVLRRDLTVVHDEGGTQDRADRRSFSGTYYYWNARNRLVFAARTLDRRRLLDWVLTTPRESREIVLRGGRRQFLHSAEPLVSIVKGTAAGLAVALPTLVTGRRPAGATAPKLTSVLVAHPSPDLYGSDRVVLETVAGLREQGTKVTVALPADGPLVAELAALGADVVFVDMPVLRKSAMKPKGFAALLATAARSLPQQVALVRRSGAQVLLTNTITVPMWSLVGRLAGVPTVVHVHEAEADASKVVNAVLYAPLNLAGHLVANSAFTRDVVAASYPRLARRTTVVHNGVAGPDAIVAPPAGDQPRLVYVGRLSPRKGPDVAVKALAALREQGITAHLSLVGAVYPGYEWFETELRQLVDQLDLAEQVTFEGFSSNAAQHLAAADIALVPSVGEESFGNTAVEALLAARPLVVSDHSGLAEATKNFVAVRRVAPNDPQALAEAVAELWDDHQEFAFQARQDAQEAERRYSPARYRRTMAQLLATLAG